VRAAFAGSGGAGWLGAHMVADPGHDVAEVAYVVAGERVEQHAADDLYVAGHSPRFLGVQELSPHNVLHTFRLTSPADVDAEFVTWLAEAYRVGAQDHRHRRQAPIAADTRVGRPA